MASEKRIRNQFSVGSLAAAIGRRREYPTAIGFAIAPLRTRTGNRAWHGIDPDRMSWEKLGGEGVVIPSIDAGDEVPTLPPSPLSLWEFGYIDKDAEIMRPTLTIDPALNVSTGNTQEADDSASRVPTGTATDAPRIDGLDGTPPILLALLELSRSKDRHSLAVLQAAQQSQGQAWEKLMGLMDSYDEMQKQTATQRDDAIKQLRDVVAVNADLGNQLAEARENAQLHITIRELFSGKPELLVDSLKGLAIAVIEKIKS